MLPETEDPSLRREECPGPGGHGERDAGIIRASFSQSPCRRAAYRRTRDPRTLTQAVLRPGGSPSDGVRRSLAARDGAAGGCGCFAHGADGGLVPGSASRPQKVARGGARAGLPVRRPGAGPNAGRSGVRLPARSRSRHRGVVGHAPAASARRGAASSPSRGRRLQPRRPPPAAGLSALGASARRRFSGTWVNSRTPMLSLTSDWCRRSGPRPRPDWLRSRLCPGFGSWQWRIYSAGFLDVADNGSARTANEPGRGE